MGFKPMSKLKEYHYIKPASFFYPEDTVSVCVPLYIYNIICNYVFIN